MQNGDDRKAAKSWHVSFETKSQWNFVCKQFWKSFNFSWPVYWFLWKAAIARQCKPNFFLCVPWETYFTMIDGGINGIRSAIWRMRCAVFEWLATRFSLKKSYTTRLINWILDKAKWTIKIGQKIQAII